MTEQKIEENIGDILTGDVQKNVLEFVAYLRANEILFEKDKSYWKNIVKCNLF